MKLASKLNKNDIKPVITFAKKHKLNRWFIFYDWELERIEIDWIEIILLPFVF